VLVMTTNLGSEAFSQKGRAVGFGAVESAGAPSKNAASSARSALPPELWNRIDERLVFEPLAEPHVAKIAELLLTESSRRLRVEKGIEYVASEEVIRHLLSSGGYDPALGARPMRQTVQRLVEGPLAERILSGEFGTGDKVRVEVRSGELAFRREARS
jgi:ATP-dependent Clp protease ATP-binding subunit ClpC